MALAFAQLAASAVTPALANVTTAFPAVPELYIAMLSTLPSLLSVPATLLASALLEKGVGYRSLAMFGMISMLISGVGPYFANSFYAILAWRSLFGFGTGCAIPLLMPLTMHIFGEENATKQMGSNTISTNIGAIVFQLAGGFLCTQFGWKSTFLIYLLLLPCVLAVVFLLPEPETAALKNTKQTLKASPKQKASVLPGMRWCIADFFYMVFFYALVTQTSSVIQASGFGTAGMAGIVLSLFTVGGVVGALLFRRAKWVARHVFLVSYASMGLGFCLMAVSVNIWMLIAGELFVGVGFGLCTPAMSVSMGFAVKKQARARAASWLAIFGNMGGFLSAFLLSAAGQTLGFSGGRFMFWASAVYFAVALCASPLLGMAGLQRLKAKDGSTPAN